MKKKQHHRLLGSRRTGRTTNTRYHSISSERQNTPSDIIPSTNLAIGTAEEDTSQLLESEDLQLDDHHYFATTFSCPPTDSLVHYSSDVMNDDQDFRQTVTDQECPVEFTTVDRKVSDSFSACKRYVEGKSIEATARTSADDWAEWEVSDSFDWHEEVKSVEATAAGIADLNISDCLNKHLEGESIESDTGATVLSTDVPLDLVTRFTEETSLEGDVVRRQGNTLLSAFAEPFVPALFETQKVVRFDRNPPNVHMLSSFSTGRDSVPPLQFSGSLRRRVGFLTRDDVQGTTREMASPAKIPLTELLRPRRRPRGTILRFLLSVTDHTKAQPAKQVEASRTPHRPRIFYSHGKKVTMVDEKYKVFVIDLLSTETCDAIRRITDAHVKSVERSGDHSKTWRMLYTYTKMDLPCSDVTNLPVITNEILECVVSIVSDVYGSPEAAVQLKPRSWKEPHLLLYQKERHKPVHTGIEMHYDGCHITWQAMLSDPMEYRGGGTYFRLLRTTLKLQKGQVLVHPGELFHKGLDITRGTRYLIICFMDGFDPRVADRSREQDDQDEHERNVCVF